MKKGEEIVNKIWEVFQRHIKIEGEQMVAVVVASSEARVREMLKIENLGAYDPKYEKTNWLEKETARCNIVGTANPGEGERIIFFRPIAHNLVYGPEEQRRDRIYAILTGQKPPKKRF